MMGSWAFEKGTPGFTPGWWLLAADELHHQVLELAQETEMRHNEADNDTDEQVSHTGIE